MPEMADVVVGVHLELGGLELCGACRHFRGPWRSTRASAIHEQECACAPAVRRPGPVVSEDGASKVWPGYDYNEVAELCRCCGLDVLPSGSRWSVWVCEHYKDWVWDFNERVGRCVIPIGRHSMMNGFALPGSLARDDALVEQFANDMRSLVERMNWTDAWARRVVTRNLSACGLASGKDVPLGEYLGRARALLPRPQKPSAVRAMLDGALNGVR
jgi:hypothetical protein